MKVVENAMFADEFLNYLKNEKRMAKNSLDAYKGDVNDFNAFLKKRGIADITKATNTEVVAYLLDLKESGRSASTINRKLASLRSFCRFLLAFTEESICTSLAGARPAWIPEVPALRLVPANILFSG